MKRAWGIHLERADEAVEQLNGIWRGPPHLSQGADRDTLFQYVVAHTLVDIAVTLHELVDQLDDLNAHLEER